MIPAQSATPAADPTPEKEASAGRFGIPHARLHWYLLAGAGVSGFASLLLTPFAPWLPARLFPSTSIAVPIMTLLLAGLAALGFRGRPAPVAVPLTITIAAILMMGGIDVSRLLHAVPGAPATGLLLGLQPAMCLILLSMLVGLNLRGEEMADPPALTISFVLLFLSTTGLLISLSGLLSDSMNRAFGSSLFDFSAFALLTAACLWHRRATFTNGIFAQDMPAWHILRTAVPLALLLPIDRLILSMLRPQIAEPVFEQLNVAVTAFNLLVLAFLFNWIIWRFSRLYRAALNREAQLALAIEAPGAGVFDWNVATGELMWTPEAERRIGMPLGSMNHIDIWAALVESEDAARIFELHAAVEAQHGNHYSFHYRLRTANGELRTFEGTARCFYDAAGSIVRVVGINLDVTERDELDAQLRSIFQNVPDAMLTFDKRGIIRSFSPTAQRMFGHAEAQIVGMSLAALLPEGSRLRIEQLHSPEGQADPARFGNAFMRTGLRANGETFPAEITVALANTPRGNLFIAFVRDVTERIKAEARLEEMRDEFAHRNRLDAMGELTAGIAHELNQPLTAGANYLAAAQTVLGEDGGDVRRFVGSAKAEFVRAAEIIRRMRDFLAKGDAEMLVENVEQTIRDAIGLIGAQQMAVKIDYSIAPGATRMLADRVQVQQILVNLMRNAAQAMRDLPAERKQIWIEARPVARGMLEISVRDAGTGFPPEVLQKLFDPFFSTGQGMGVGMSICRRIVEAHGGEMRAYNTEQGGACVAFTVPGIPDEI